MSVRPLIALTLGDPAGTGPEIILKALAQPEVSGLGRLLVVGDAATLDRAQTYAGTRLAIRSVNAPAEAKRLRSAWLDGN